MTYWEKNNEALKKRGINLSFDIKDDWEDTNYYSIEKTRSGNPVLIYNKDDKTKRMESKFNPEKEGFDFLEKYKYKIERQNIIILFGMGMGYTAKAILKNINPGNLFLIVEPSWHIFKLALENADISDILSDERVSLILGDDKTSYDSHLKSSISVKNFEKIVYMITPGYQKIFLDEYKYFIEILLNTVKERRVTYDTFRHLGKLWTETVINNINHITESYSLNCLQHIFNNKPIIMVAAGPSLDKNIKQLKKVKNKFPIVAVYTAYKVLKKHGIKPDLIVSIDAEQTMYETEAVKKERYDIPILYIPISEPALVDKFIGKKVFCRSEHMRVIRKIMPEKVNDVRNIFIGGTVAVSALWLACYMGGNPTIITGLDLGSSTDKTHAEGTFYDHVDEKVEVISKENEVWLDGIDGNKVRADLLFENYLWSTQELIRANRHIKFIDATEGGALIKGTEIDTLKNVLKNYKDKSTDDVESILNKAFKKKMCIKKDVQDIKRNLKKSKKLTKQFIGYLKQGITYSENVKKLFVYGNVSDEKRKEITNFYNVLDEKLNDLMDETPLFYNVIERVMSVLKMHQPDKNTPPEIYFADHTLYLYKEMLDIIERIDLAFEQVINKIQNKSKIDGG